MIVLGLSDSVEWRVLFCRGLNRDAGDLRQMLGLKAEVALVFDPEVQPSAVGQVLLNRTEILAADFDFVLRQCEI